MARAAPLKKTGATRSTAATPARKSDTKGDAPARVLRRFRTVFNAVRSHFRAIEQTSGISGAQAWALSQIAAHPGLGVGQLAKAMDLHQSTASNLVRALMDAGLIVSERASTDQRAVHLHPTARGLKLLAKTPTPFVGALPEALRRLDAATLARLDGDLAKLLGELRADPRGAKELIAGD